LQDLYLGAYQEKHGQECSIAGVLITKLIKYT